MENSNNFGNGTEVTVSFSRDGYVMDIIGEDALLVSMNVDVPSRDVEYMPLFNKEIIPIVKPFSHVTINLEFQIPYDKYKTCTYNTLFSQKKIRNKKVENCSIQELLFAIRNKNKEEK